MGAYINYWALNATNALHPLGLGSISVCLHLHETHETQLLQIHWHLCQGLVEDGLHHNDWSVSIPHDAIWFSQQPVYLPGIHDWPAGQHTVSLSHYVHWHHVSSEGLVLSLPFLTSCWPPGEPISARPTRSKKPSSTSRASSVWHPFF